MTFSRRAFIGSMSAMAGAAALPKIAFANTYPDRTVRWVTPYAPGGGTDITARAVALHVGNRVGQSVIIDNRAGANGLIGADFVAKSAPDGYTLLAVTSGHLLQPLVVKKMPYDTMKDLVAITALARSPLIFVAAPDLPVNSLQELAQLVRDNPGKYSFGSAENFGLLVNTMWNHREKLDAVHIPYKGSGQLLPDLVSGTIQFAVTSIPAGKGFIQTGRMKALAVTGQERAKDLPDVPTVAESGHPDFVIYNHYSLFAPAGTSNDILEKVQQDVNAAVKQPEVAAFFEKQSLEPAAMSVSEFQALVSREFESLGRLAKEANLSLG